MPAVFIHAGGLPEANIDVQGNVSFACAIFQRSSHQLTEEIGECFQRDNTFEGHKSSLVKRKICWICQEEFENETSLMDHYNSHMELIALLRPLFVETDNHLGDAPYTKAVAMFCCHVLCFFRVPYQSAVVSLLYSGWHALKCNFVCFWKYRSSTS